MIAALTCLRLIGEQFPKAFSVKFGRSDFEFVKDAFEKWYELVKDKLPAKYRDAILDEANIEFALFEERILKRPDQKS